MAPAAAHCALLLPAPGRKIGEVESPFSLFLLALLNCVQEFDAQTAKVMLWMTLLTHRKQEELQCKLPKLSRAQAFRCGTIPPLCPASYEGSHSKPNLGKEKVSNVFISLQGHSPSSQPCLAKHSKAGGKQSLISLPSCYSEASRRLESQETAEVQLCSLLGMAQSSGLGELALQAFIGEGSPKNGKEGRSG